MQSGKLFIGGISWNTNEEILKDYFGSFGEVLEAVIMKDQTTGRARGFGFIIFSDPVVADRVVTKTHKIDGRMVEVKKAVPKDDRSNTISRSSGSIQGSPGPPQTRKLFVGGLGSTVTESDFKSYFEQFGTVTYAVVMYDLNTQRPRGFGFITFESEDSVDNVLVRPFHELNGKMVEVKRAVPKELIPSPVRNPLGGYNYGLGRISTASNDYNQGYSPNGVGGLGVRIDGRSSPIVFGKSGFAPFGSGYEMNSNLEQGMSQNHGGNPTLNNSFSYRSGMNPFYKSSSFNNSIGFDGENAGNAASLFSSSPRNLWGDMVLNHGMNFTNSSGFWGSRSGSIGGGNFGNNGLLRDFSPVSPMAQGGRNLCTQGSSLGYGGIDNSYNFGGGAYGRHSTNTRAPISPYSASNGSYDATVGNMYGRGPVYDDSTWRSANLQEDSGAYSYGLGDGANAAQIRRPPDYIGGYGVPQRQTNRGIVG